MNEWEEENDNKQDTSKGENFKTRTESRQSRQIPTTFTFSHVIRALLELSHA